MHVLSLFRWGAPLEAPVLTLITGSTDNTPDFVLTGDLAELDTVRFSYGTASDFTGATETTNAIDAAEDAANALDFATGSLANNTWYFRARIERPPNPTISGWSNTETITLTGATSQGSVRSLFGRWLGGFGANNGTAGYRSLFGWWLGGFSAAPVHGDKSRALRQLQREGHHTRGLHTEAEYREIALRREKQERQAAFVMLQERIAEAKRQEALLRVAPEPAPKVTKAKRTAAPIVRPPDPAIEQRRLQARAKIARLEAIAKREQADLRRLEANLRRIEQEAADEEEAMIVMTLLM